MIPAYTEVLSACPIVTASSRPYFTITTIKKYYWRYSLRRAERILLADIGQFIHDRPTRCEASATVNIMVDSAAEICEVLGSRWNLVFPRI